LWRPECLRQAEAFVADYNAQTQGTKIELSVGSAASSNAPRAAAA
jgi:hypothetical protein